MISLLNLGAQSWLMHDWCMITGVWFIVYSKRSCFNEQVHWSWRVIFTSQYHNKEHSSALWCVLVFSAVVTVNYIYAFWLGQVFKIPQIHWCWSPQLIYKRTQRNNGMQTWHLPQVIVIYFTLCYSVAGFHMQFK